MIKVARTSESVSEKVSTLHSLLKNFLLTETDIDLYAALVQGISFKNTEQKLALLYEIQNSYCYLAIEDKCLKVNNFLKDLASEFQSEEYLFSTYLTLAFYYFDKGDKEASKMELFKAKETMLKSGSDILKNKYFNEVSRQMRVQGKLDSALFFNQLALENPDIRYNYQGIADSYNNQGRIYRQLGKMDSAEQAYLKALELSVENDLLEKLPKIYNNLGNMNHIKGSFDEAIAFYVKSIEIKEKRGDIKGLSIGHHNIGAIKVDLMDYEGAIREFQKSNELAEKVNFKSLLVHNANKIGDSYYHLKAHDKAKSYYEKAIKISEEIGFKGGNTLALVGSGFNLIAQGEMSLAFERLDKAYAQSVSSGNKSNECSALIGIAEWYAHVDNTDREADFSFDHIESLLLRAKELSEELEYGEKRLLVYKGLDKLYKESGSFKKHSELMSEYLQYKDTIFSQERTNAIADWETKYATAEKEKEILQLQTANEISKLKTRSWQIALGIITFFLALLGLFLYKYQQRKNEQNRLEEAEQFRSKISSDLHDDVGTILSSLAMQSEVMGLTAQKEQVDKFVKLSKMSREAMTRMRDTVWAIDARKDKVVDLLDRMKDYVYDRLEGHKLKATFNFEVINKDLKLRPDIRQNIYLIFKEAVHNAAKYSNGDTLYILLKQEGEELYLEVSDNGKIDKHAIKTSGLGTSNMKMRAERIGKKLTIKVENGYQVIVK